MVDITLENNKEKQLQPLKFYLFLKERYENNYHFKYQYLPNYDINQIKKDTKTIFMNQYTEKELIKRYFINKKIDFI